MQRLRRLFEQGLWASRLVMLVAVVASMLMALGAFYMATMDVLRLPAYLAAYTDLHLADEARADLRANAITLIVKAVDGYIITAILIIFSLGLYQFFFAKLRVAGDSEAAPQLLRIGGLDDLKDRIAKLLMLVLVIEFFQRALRVDYQRALELLYLAVGILLIGTTLYVGRLKGSGGNNVH